MNEKRKSFCFHNLKNSLDFQRKLDYLKEEDLIVIDTKPIDENSIEIIYIKKGELI